MKVLNMRLKSILSVLLATMAVTYVSPVFAKDAVCYNCPPQWADWASMLKAIDKEIDIQMPHDNKNSGQTLSQLLAERIIQLLMLLTMVLLPVLMAGK